MAGRSALRSVWAVLNDGQYRTVPFWVWSGLFVLLEGVAGVFIINRVPYTEIDWNAYMEQVSQVAGGERDYAEIRGGTGPLVYPAGFVYIYTVIAWLTGGQVRSAQYVFLGLYLASQLLVMNIYRNSSLPPWILALLMCSRRLHSIFILRLFNDGIAMMFAFVGVLFAQRDRYGLAAAFLSLGVGVKMNVLLFLPGLAVLMVERVGVLRSMGHALVFLAIQLVLGAPFLFAYPASYMGRAFEFGRKFMYTWWVCADEKRALRLRHSCTLTASSSSARARPHARRTVNYKFLAPDVFVSPTLAAGLLLMHVVVLVVAAQLYCAPYGGLAGVIARGLSRPASPKPLPPNRVATVLFVSNFIGVVFARSLHYQFYAWYVQTLPFLVYKTDLPWAARLVLLLFIEVVWNVYPSSPLSSIALQFFHVTLLLALLFARDQQPSRRAHAD